MDEAIRLQPDLARAYCNRGLAHARQQDYDAAIADAGTGIDEDAALPLCYFVRGNSYMAKGEYQKAIGDLSTGLKLYPANAEGLSRRGEAYERVGERVIGSGIMAARPSSGNDVLALLCNTLATGVILVVIITIVAPISGAHFNPAVTL